MWALRKLDGPDVQHHANNYARSRLLPLLIGIWRITRREVTA